MPSFPLNLSQWKYRKRITISGSSGAGTNYQVLLKVGESSGASGADFHLEGASEIFPSGKNQGGDLRFALPNGTLLDFWVESVTGTSPNRVAYIWVEVADNLDTDKDIYIYFGNSGATNYSNLENTFIRIITGLVGCWHFDEGSGTTAYDSSGSNNHGTLYNGPTWVDGKFGKALGFDGVNDYVRVSRNIQDDFTVQLWLKTSVNSLTNTHAYHGNGIVWSDVAGAANDMIPMAYLNNKLAFGTGNSSGTYHTLFSNSTLNTGNWIHLAVTRVKSTGEKKVYVNGVLENTQTSVTVSLNANSIIDIGGNTLDSRYFNGIIDEVHFYNRALSASEILDLYNYYGHTTLEEPGKVLVRKRVSPEPAFSSAGPLEKRSSIVPMFFIR